MSLVSVHVIVIFSCTTLKELLIERRKTMGCPQDQDRLLVKRHNDNHSAGPVLGKLAPSSHQRSEFSNTILCNLADEIRESGRTFQSLIVWGKKLHL